jgi:hypothetical protein
MLGDSPASPRNGVRLHAEIVSGITSEYLAGIDRNLHLLLQVQARALDGTLRALFERWRPGNENLQDQHQPRAA